MNKSQYPALNKTIPLKQGTRLRLPANVPSDIVSSYMCVSVSVSVSVCLCVCVLCVRVRACARRV